MRTIVMVLVLGYAGLASAAPSSVVPLPRPAAGDGGAAERPTPYPRPEQITEKTLFDLMQEAEAASATAEDDAWLNDPFVYVERDMGRVSGLLEKQRSDDPVQRDQAEVVRKLDVLIEKLQQASQNCSGGAGGGSSGEATNNPTSPMQDSQLTGGPGGMGDLRDPDRDPKRWADLPPKDREKVLQSRTDGFPTGYEQLLEDYYRKLAEADSAADADEQPND